MCVCVCVCVGGCVWVGVLDDHIAWMLVYARVGVLCSYTGMCRVTTLRSTTDRIYDGGPIRL